MALANIKEVSILVNNKEHKAIYKVWKGVVTVTYNNIEKSTQIGNLETEHVARMLLSELVRE